MLPNRGLIVLQILWGGGGGLYCFYCIIAKYSRLKTSIRAVLLENIIWNWFDNATFDIATTFMLEVSTTNNYWNGLAHSKVCMVFALLVRLKYALQRQLHVCIYSFSGNSAASAPNSTFMCLWAIYIFPAPGSVYIFPPVEQADPSWEYIIRSQTHECGNWDWGPNIPFLGIFVSNFRHFVFAVYTQFEAFSFGQNTLYTYKKQV